MQRSILKFPVSHELDVVLAYKRTMQLSEHCGIALANQTKFATAVSEICRNVIEYVGEGAIQFNIVKEKGILYLEALISDRGRGIGDPEYYLNQKPGLGVRGLGLANSRKLVDDFKLDTESEKGTRIKLRKRIPASHPIISKAVIENWVNDFQEDLSVSPYAEIKNQNMQLVELLEQLQQKNQETEKQLSEIKRLNLELLSSNEEITHLLSELENKNNLLENKNQELDAFAHIVSHDLRAPLQNIKGLSMLIDSYLQTNEAEKAVPVLRMVDEQTNRMDNLILDILSYSLAGKKKLKITEVNLRELLYEVISFLNIPAGFQVHLPEKLPILRSEEIFLRQIFNNLLNNAIKHHDMPAGNIWIGYENLGTELRFSVQDDGPGIDAAAQPRIFEQFETLQYQSRSAGTGLGLSIIKKITFEKNGTTWVESEGRGSKFCFTWPASELVKEI